MSKKLRMAYFCVIGLSAALAYVSGQIVWVFANEVQYGGITLIEPSALVARVELGAYSFVVLGSLVLIVLSAALLSKREGKEQ